MKKATLFLLASLAVSFGAQAYDYEDDIYYNPKKEAKKTATKQGGQYMAELSVTIVGL